MRAVTVMEFKVGILIIAGILAVLSLVLISDRLRFDRYYHVSAYLADAAGLRPNSPVTLAGIRIGEVDHLLPVQDARGVIKAVLRINERYPLPANAQVTISSSGIFGDSYLAFSAPHGSSDGQRMAVDGSAAVVASKGFLENASQQAERLLASANEFMGAEMRSEMKRLITNAADLAKAGTDLAKHLDAQNRQLGETLAAVKSLSEELRTRSVTVGSKVEQGLEAYTRLAASAQQQTDTLGPKIAASLERLDALGKRGEDTLTGTAGDLKAALATFAELGTRLNHIASAVESGQGVAGKLVMDQDLARDVDSMSVDLSRTAAYLAEHPEAVVFGMKKRSQDAERAHREREKARRQLLAPPSGVRLDEFRDMPATAKKP